MTAKGSFFPRRTNQYVPNMQYAADVRKGGNGKIKIPALAAAAAAGILSAQSIAIAGNTSAFLIAFTEAQMGRFGRNVTVAASGAATSKVTVHGMDYLGQPMSEELTLAGAAAVAGKKTFRWIDRVDFGATAGTTINLGYGDVLGLPYKLIDNYTEIVDGVEATDAGTIVAGSKAAQSATSAEPRGTYKPHTNNVPNGARVYELYGLFDDTNLHGNAHYFGLT